MESLLSSLGRSLLLRARVISAVFVLLFVALAVLVSIDGARSKVVTTTTGIVDNVAVHIKKGAYDYSTLRLLGDGVSYTYNHAAFTPALTDEMLAGGVKVDLWYTENVFGAPRIIALQLYGGQGEHPIRYLTRDYLQPDRASKEDTTFASICALLATLSAITFAVLLRVGRGKRGDASDMSEATLVRFYGGKATGKSPASASPFGQPRRDDTPFWEKQIRQQERNR